MSWALPLRTVTLAIILIVLCSCDFGREPLQCDCPELEDAVAEVNWAPALSILSTESGRNGFLEVVVVYDGEGHDAGALESRVIEAMEQSGYEISELQGGAIEGRFQDTTIWVSQSSEPNSNSQDLRIAVKFDGFDGPETHDQLAPLRDQLADE